MNPEQAEALIVKASEIVERLDSVLLWLQLGNSYMSFFVTVFLPGVVFIGLMWWALKQFLDRYY